MHCSPTSEKEIAKHRKTQKRDPIVSFSLSTAMWELFQVSLSLEVTIFLPKSRWSTDPVPVPQRGETIPGQEAAAPGMLPRVYCRCPSFLSCWSYWNLEQEIRKSSCSGYKSLLGEGLCLKSKFWVISVGATKESLRLDRNKVPPWWDSYRHRRHGDGIEGYQGQEARDRKGRRCRRCPGLHRTEEWTNSLSRRCEFMAQVLTCYLWLGACF